jgi:superfamily I DNA/RNA helicase
LPPPKLEWSPLQLAIFEDIAHGSGHTVVIARAGSSKTTTLVEGVKYIPKNCKNLFVAFNKNIAEELKDKLPSYVEARTMHSLGYAAVRERFGKVALDPEKTFNLAQQYLESQGIKKQAKYAIETTFSLKRTVGLCKGYLYDTPSKIDILMDDFDIDCGLLDRDDFLKAVCQLLRRGKEMVNVIDYDEMIYFPYVYNLPTPKFDRVFIDEEQDFNGGQIHLALKACKADGRVLACADDRQALYSWRGADSKAVDNIVKKLNAKILPLSVSYRCAKNIISLAQEIVPDIEHAPWAVDGLVEEADEDRFLTKVKPGDFILSRINAPIIKYCLQLLKAGTPANILGRDVGASLAYMIKRSEAKTIPAFLKWLDRWKTAEVKRLREKNRSAIIVLDKVQCLEGLCENVKTIDDVLENIKRLFNDGDDSTRVILSTVHRAKGLERNRVWLLMNTFRFGDTVEEKNIEYVGITRAKTELYLVR